MATLPDETALGERPTPQPTASVASYSPVNNAAFGQGISAAGREMQQAAEIIAQTNSRQDQMAAVDAANRLKQATLGLEQDPNTGFLRAKGNGVVGPEFVKGYQQKFQDASSEIAGTLTSENQKRLFQRHAQVVGLQYQSSLLQHQAKETLAFNQTTRANTVELGMNDIAAHPYDQSTFDTNLLLMGNAVVDSARDMGLTGKELADFTKSKLVQMQSKALYYRTSAMLNDNPMQAADFFHKHELDFDPQTRMELGRAIKTTTDAQTTRLQGVEAFKAATAAAPGAPALPQDYGADFVKPYDPPRIQKIVDAVKAPSQYDSLFEKYAKAYNVSPTELKLRAVSESGMNPNAKSPAGAVGLMQFMPATAQQYGIDPTDPEQAIAGAAKLMAANGGTLGGDMSKVDRTYYGGNANAKGPNTDQYVDNLRSVRQQLFGSASAPQSAVGLEAAESRVIDQAKAIAQQSRPGDLVYQQQVVGEARREWAQQVSAVKAQDYANFSNILGVSIGPAGAKSLSDLPPQQQEVFSKLPPERQHSLYNLWKSNQNDAGSRETPENTRNYLALMGQAVTDPVAFKNRDIAADIADLPKGQQGQVLNAFVGIDKDAAKGADYTKALSDLRSQILMAKINIPTASNPKSEDYDAFAGKLRGALDAFVENHKRKPNQQELQTLAAPLFADFTVTRPFLWDKTVKGFQVTPEQEAKITSEIGAPERQAITSSFASRYGRAPVESEIQQRYLIQRLHPGDRTALQQYDQAVRANSERMSTRKVSVVVQ